MRKLALFSLAPLSLLACTAILGDFTVGTVAVDGGGDGNPGDVISNPDAPSDAADGSAAVKLTCLESKQAGHVHLGDVYTGNNGGNPNVWIFTYQNNNNTYAHVLVQGALHTDAGYDTNITHTFTFRTGSGGTSAVDTPLLGMQVESVRRYRAPSGSTGIAALMLDYSTGLFWITTMADDSNDGGVPVWADLFQVPGAALAQTCRVVATFEPVDPPNHDYVVAATYNPGSCSGTTAPVLAVNRTSSSNGFVTLSGFPTPDGGAASSYDLGRDAITTDGTSFYLMVTLGGGSGPTSGASPVIYKNILGTATQTQLKLAAPSHLLYPLGMRASSAIPTDLDMALLGGDIQTQAGLFVGHTPFSNLANVTPETDLSAIFAGLTELPVNSGAAHWDDLLGTIAPNLLAISAPPTGGANLWWFDESGNVRARQTGTSALFPGETIMGVDIALAQALPIFGNLEAAFLEPSDGGANTYSVYASEIDCAQ